MEYEIHRNLKKLVLNMGGVIVSNLSAGTEYELYKYVQSIFFSLSDFQVSESKFGLLPEGFATDYESWQLVFSCGVLLFVVQYADWCECEKVRDS